MTLMTWFALRYSASIYAASVAGSTGSTMNAVEPWYEADSDLLSTESKNLVKLYGKGCHPTLTNRRRAELWQMTMDRCSTEERKLCDEMRIYRRIPGISREVVAAAFGADFLTTPPTPARPPEPYAQLPGASSGGVHIEDAARTRAPEQRPLTQAEAEAKARYDAAYRRLRWG